MNTSAQYAYSIGALITLDPAERAIAAYRLTAENPVTHAWLAELLELSPDRVRRIESELLMKLRRGLNTEYPRPNREGRFAPEPRRLEQ